MEELLAPWTDRKTGNGILGTLRRVQASVLVRQHENWRGAVVKRRNQSPKGRDSGLFSYLPSINLQLGSLIPDLSEWGAVSVATNSPFDGC